MQTRQPGDRDAEDRDKATEEDGLRTVTLEEGLATLEERRAVTGEGSGKHQQRPGTTAAERIAQVVAEDRGQGATPITIAIDISSLRARTPAANSAVSPAGEHPPTRGDQGKEDEVAQMGRN